MSCPLSSPIRSHQLQQPAVRAVLPAATAGGRPDAISRLRFSEPGRTLAVGDASGRVHIYELAEVRLKLSFFVVLFPPTRYNQRLAHPRADEGARLRETLADMAAA